MSIKMSNFLIHLFIIKVIAAISPDDVKSALCLAFEQNCVEKSPKNQARNIISEFLAKNYFDLAAEAEEMNEDFGELTDDESDN